MRAFAIVLAGALAASACASLIGIKDPTLAADGGAGDDAMVTVDSGPPLVDGGPPLVDGATPMDAARPDSGPMVDAAPGTPVITRVSWTPLPGCFSGFPAGYTVTTTVTDSDTQPIDLTVSGSIDGCSSITDTSTSVSCSSNSGAMMGSVTVTDPQGHSATVNFTVHPCTAGSAP